MTVDEPADNNAVTRHPLGIGGFAMLAMLAGVGVWLVADRAGQFASDARPLLAPEGGYGDALSWSSSREIRLQKFSVAAAAMVEEIATEPNGSDVRRIDAAPSAGAPMPNAVPDAGPSVVRSAPPAGAGTTEATHSHTVKDGPGGAGSEAVPKAAFVAAPEQWPASGSAARIDGGSSVAASLPAAKAGSAPDDKGAPPLPAAVAGGVGKAADVSAVAAAQGAAPADQSVLRPSVETKARDPQAPPKGGASKKRPAKAAAPAAPEANRIQFGNVFE